MSTVAFAPHPLLPKAEHNNVRAAIGSDLWNPDCALEGAAMGLDWKEGL